MYNVIETSQSGPIAAYKAALRNELAPALAAHQKKDATAMSRNIYLAALMSRQKEMQYCAGHLKAHGHHVCSRWIWTDAPEWSEKDTALGCEYAQRDYADLLMCDTLILFTGEPRTPTRGGRMVEFGMALAMGVPIYCVGASIENVFMCLPGVNHCETLEDAMEKMNAHQADDDSMPLFGDNLPTF